MSVETHPFEFEVPGHPGRVIRGRIVAAEGAAAGPPRPHVLVVHGFKGFMDWGFFPELGRRLAAEGLAAVCFNVSGSGIGPDLHNFTDEEGFAANTYSRELEDIAAVRTWLKGANLGWIDLQVAAIFGHSRGGGMALVHAAEAGDLAAVVTWAAISRVASWDEPTRELWRHQGHVFVHNARTGQDHRIDLTLLEDAEAHAERLDPVTAAGRITAPLLLVHGDADEAVPATACEALAAANPRARTLLVPGAGHTFGARHPLQGEVPGDLETVLGTTCDFLAEHLGLDRPSPAGPA